jgi:NADH dehydrogenase
MIGTSPADSRPHVVIIGGGFGGIAAATHLEHAAVRVTLIDRTNHHTFQPLLYQVATAGLAPSDITVPIRWRLRGQKNAEVILATVTSIDVRNRTVQLSAAPGEVHYDYLIVAPGTRHAYFGHPEWEAFAPGLKSVEDAHEIRQRFLLAFEHAETAADEATRRQYLTFVIVGGGATGVEMAGAMSETARAGLYREFRHSDPRRSRVLLVEAGNRLLPAFPRESSERAKGDLEKLGVEVRLGAPITNVARDSVSIGDERIMTNTIVWAAGNSASPLGRQLDAETNKAGRVLVSPDLSVPAHPEVFVIGDLVFALRTDGTPVPEVAPTAMQTGKHAAKMIMRSVAGQSREDFKYFHKGDLATIGRNKAVAVAGKIQIGGHLAWFAWVFIHLLYLAGFRNRVSVLIQWMFAYFTRERGARLIDATRGPVAMPHPTSATPSTLALAPTGLPDARQAVGAGTQPPAGAHDGAQTS